MVEWGILVVLVLVLAGVFGRQVRVVQGQAELAAVQSTLGALRTAFVIEHLQQTVKSTQPGVAALQRNPFLLLKEPPVNYAGEFSVLKMDAVVPRSWVFDPDCECIGYLLLHPQWLESPPDTAVVWFRISAPPGPLSITPLHTYIWQGQVVN
jgi:hypothetical protein